MNLDYTIKFYKVYEKIRKTTEEMSDTGLREGLPKHTVILLHML